ncbi:MAG: hypothetical protein Q8N12_03120 [Thermodesulfovibrionales bacterium]|nr:hypothetical protein [Nitrospinota bacterium]MCG2813218.1 hypothetical protein [Thermodesulfovibrionales bacterium]MDP3048408.1 hypothetical protein [Thermodesulfovibrionales bacterium]
MRKLVFVGFLVGILLWLAGCGSTYKYIEVEYPISPYTKYKALNLELISHDDADKEELKSFRELIISALQKRGIVVVNDVKSPKLIVEVAKFNKDAISSFVRDWVLGPPFGFKTTNLIDIKVFIKDQAATTEFKKFQEYKESVRNWEDLKRTVANSIADAVYFAH